MNLIPLRTIERAAKWIADVAYGVGDAMEVEQLRRRALTPADSDTHDAPIAPQLIHDAFAIGGVIQGSEFVVEPTKHQLSEYGYDRTIHNTQHVDVETDWHGRVVSVWFRCAMLPFTQTSVDDARAKSMRSAIADLPHNLVAVTFDETMAR